MNSLFDILGDDDHIQVDRRPDEIVAGRDSIKNWELKPPPNISGVRELEIDWETSGLKWWTKAHRPGGAGICLPDGSTHYLAWGHRGGGNNISEEAARCYFNDIRNVHITNLNTRFEVHMGREWGVDFEANGCTVADVGHFAALLDDHRQEHSLASIVRDYLTDEAKVNVVDGIALDGSRMMEYHAGTVAVRAEADVRQVHKLKKLMLPKLTAEGLDEVRKLEEEVIYVVCEMEKNGTYTNVPLLDQWLVECEREWKQCLHQIYKNTGLSVNPTSNDDMKKLFRARGLESMEMSPSGKQPSFKEDVLKKFEDENIKLALRAKQLRSLESKYLKKYRRNVDSDGLLRYALHQLRAQKGDEDDRSAGTITGRFSSAAFTFPKEPDYGVNIQQVMKVAKQIAKYGARYLIRQLHVPKDRRHLHLSADAEQIEYRIFASLANTPKVIQAYKDNPGMSFHKFMHELIKPFVPTFTYRQQKDLNFAVIYAAGLAKMAFMLGYITKSEMEDIKDSKNYYDPRLKETREIRRIYDEVVPEVKGLLATASRLAETRGYVMTVMGRRMRFPEKQRLHKALNGVIQGSAADVNKKKLVELHQQRKHTGLIMRYTVHDEVDGDIPDAEGAAKVSEILNTQSFAKLRVPIRWAVKTGANWRECADD